MAEETKANLRKRAQDAGIDPRNMQTRDILKQLDMVKRAEDKIESMIEKRFEARSANPQPPNTEIKHTTTAGTESVPLMLRRGEGVPEAGRGGGSGMPGGRLVSNVTWDSTEGKLVVAYSDGSTSDIVFSDCPA